MSPQRDEHQQTPPPLNVIRMLLHLLVTCYYFGYYICYYVCNYRGQQRNGGRGGAHQRDAEDL